MKTTRLRARIKAFLAGRPRSTIEILEHINTSSCHGTTTQQLGNVLSKDPDIIKIGSTRRAGFRQGHYGIALWGLRANEGEVNQ